MPPKTPTVMDDRFTKIAFAVITTLIATGVVGVWTMSTSISRLEERVGIWTQVGNDRMNALSARVDQVDKDQREADRRIGVLEGAQPGKRL
jgi:hypothetical protein